MSWRFNWLEIKERNRGLTYDDVLIVPTKSDVKSRRDPQLNSKLTKKISLQTPLVSANMDTITESAMMIAMNEMGGIGILHRFLTIQDQVAEIEKAKKSLESDTLALVKKATSVVTAHVADDKVDAALVKKSVQEAK
jgi:IMP dehydrogenase